MDAELVQGTPEWYRARCGSVGSSEVADIVRKTKTGVSASRAQLMAAKVIQRLTGAWVEGYRSPAMQRGIELEPMARADYELITDAQVELVGIVRHPLISGTHASPDGLVGARGLVEFKCPLGAAHLATLLGEPIDRDYMIEMQWALCCTGRDWCDYVSFNPDFPVAMRLKITRVERDPELMRELEFAVGNFLNELERKLSALNGLYSLPEAA
jgi:YqaJ-like viral recombinase domain